MSLLFFAAMGMSIVVLQSTIIQYFGFFCWIYDLLIPFFAYIGLFRPAREGIPLVLILGMIMDGLTGGPFGVYLTTYAWFYAAIRGTIKFFHLHNRLLHVVVVTLGVLFESLVVLASFSIAKDGVHLPEKALKILLIQILWAVSTGPLFMAYIGVTHRRVDRWIEKTQDKRKR